MEVVHRASLSSLGLQVCLHFNMFFSICFAVLNGSTAVEKARAYHRYIPIVALCFWACIEPWRLYFGCSANLREKVSNNCSNLKAKN